MTSNDLVDAAEEGKSHSASSTSLHVGVEGVASTWEIGSSVVVCDRVLDLRRNPPRRLFFCFLDSGLSLDAIEKLLRDEDGIARLDLLLSTGVDHPERLISILFRWDPLGVDNKLDRRLALLALGKDQSERELKDSCRRGDGSISYAGGCSAQ